MGTRPPLLRTITADNDPALALLQQILQALTGLVKQVDDNKKQIQSNKAALDGKADGSGEISILGATTPEGIAVGAYKTW